LETAKSPKTAKSQFELDGNRKISGTLSQKEAHIGCSDLPAEASSASEHRLQSDNRLMVEAKISFFLSFFLGFRRPSLITGLSGRRTPD